MPKNEYVLQQPEPIWKTLIKVVGGLFVLLLVISIFMPSEGGECIGRVKITGEIAYDSDESVFGGSGLATPTEINSLLKEADFDGRVKAILIEVNSPGGSAVASKEIYDQVRALKKPTLVYMTEMAASGGYYVSAGSDYIIGHPNTLTGSIGARASFLNYEDLFAKLGVREESIKSGELKDVGAGYRNMTVKEEKLLQGLIDETFALFRQDVEEGRKGKLNSALFNEALDARILSASQAKRIGLIDEVGGRKAVMLKANEMGGNRGISEGNLTDAELEGNYWPVCEFEVKRGFDLFSSLGTEIGKNMARGFVSGLEGNKISVKYQ